MPQKSFRDHRITLWSWFSPSVFTKITLVLSGLGSKPFTR